MGGYWVGEFSGEQLGKTAVTHYLCHSGEGSRTLEMSVDHTTDSDGSGWL